MCYYYNNLLRIHNITDRTYVPISMLYTKGFSAGCFPDFLKIAKVIPIYKKGNI